MSTSDELDPLKHIPGPASRRIALRVQPAAERAIRGGHPWLFAEAIQQQSHDGRSGDLAVIFDRKDRFLAVGLYDPHSPIRVRICHQGAPQPIDAAWMQQQLETAVALRRPLATPETNAYRLVNGANDGLPGLIVDQYADTCVVKLYTTAWLPHLRPALQALRAAALTPVQRIVLRLSRHVAQLPHSLYGLYDGITLLGAPPTEMTPFLENGLHFVADLVAGQKTGFFLDQRDNRARVEPLTAGKSVLNVFAYTGGFSLYAARGGASQVVSLDLSQPALATAMRNFKLNQHNRRVAAAAHELLVGDAFRVMTQLRESGRRFDVVVVDPPAFAQRQDQVERALTAYARLTRLALALLRRDGTLVMASCTGRVDAETFFDTVERAALGMERPLDVFDRTGHPLDHPISFPEGAYLKCLFATAP